MCLLYGTAIFHDAHQWEKDNMQWGTHKQRYALYPSTAPLTQHHFVSCEGK